ncbi:hypothetical protein, partial [Tetragenococcus halophilus]
ENNIKVTSLNSRMRYPQIFINHSGLYTFSSICNLNFSRFVNEAYFSSGICKTVIIKEILDEAI